MSINWIPVTERKPTDEEFDAGVLCLWQDADYPDDPSNWGLEQPMWKPHAWGPPRQAMPTHWCKISELELPQVAALQSPALNSENDHG